MSKGVREWLYIVIQSLYQNSVNNENECFVLMLNRLHWIPLTKNNAESKENYLLLGIEFFTGTFGMDNLSSSSAATKIKSQPNNLQADANSPIVHATWNIIWSDYEINALIQKILWREANQINLHRKN